MHDRHVRRIGHAENRIKETVSDTFFDAALHVSVLKEGQVGHHGTERTLAQVCACMCSAAFPVVVNDTYLAPPALALRCNCFLRFRDC